MRVPNTKLAELGFRAVEPAVSAAVDYAAPSVLRSVGVGLLVWFITRWLDRRVA